MKKNLAFFDQMDGLEKCDLKDFETFIFYR